MLAAKMKPRWISPEEYLQQEEIATDRHEYFKGEVFMMAGGTHNHEVICGNMFAALHQHARPKGWTASGSKKKIPVTTGTLPTHGPLFVTLLIGTVVIVGALTFFPALSLSPIVEHFLMHQGRLF